jgi:hypothetical protein
MFFQLIVGIALVLISICLYILNREVWKRR